MGQKSRLKKLRRAQVQQSKPLHSGPEALREFGFEITLEPLRKEEIPPEIRDEKPSLFQQCQVDPAGMIPRLEKLVDRYPGTASLKNWLSVAYSRVGRIEDAQAMIERAFRENPDYLFAKLGYAEICLSRNRAHEIPVIFGGKTELHELFPGRTCFHIAEFTGFYFVMCRYAIATGDLHATRRYFRKLYRGAPDSQPVEVLARQLGAALLATIDNHPAATPDALRQELHRTVQPWTA